MSNVGTGRWIRQASSGTGPAPKPKHRCRPPISVTRVGKTSKSAPDGSVGDVWECICKKQWQIKVTNSDYGSYLCWVHKWRRIKKS